MKINRYINLLLTFFIAGTLSSQIYYNYEHFKIFKSGDYKWDEWRRKNPNIKPNLRGIDFYKFLKADINHFNRTFLRLSGFDLKHLDLSNTIFSNIKLGFCKFDHANLNYAKFENVVLGDSNIFKYAKMKFTNFKKVRSFIKWHPGLNNRFDYADLSNSKFEDALMQFEIFIYANLSYTVMTKAHLFLSVFTCANLNNVTLKGAFLKSVNFSHKYFIPLSDIVEADGRGYSESKVLDSGANLANADLTDSDCEEANFIKANLTGIKLKNANLKGARIERKWKNYIATQDVRGFNEIRWE